mgnify:CR=1 FL=1
MVVRPKKSLGQNFLIDNNIINIITQVGNINSDDIVLEIGPGTGNLTKGILISKPKKLIVIEKDSNLSNRLEEKFKDKIKVINDDILKIDEKKLSNEKMIIFGNLPYNISSQILVKWIRLNHLNSFSKKFILMFQKEVADRIAAKFNEKNYGRLSILTAWRLDIKKIRDISPKSFYPVPKVESTILIMKPKNNFFKLKNPKNLEYITNVFFNQKRKMIKKPINFLFKNSEIIVKKLKLDLKLRPQNLSPENYFEICREYENLL